MDNGRVYKVLTALGKARGIPNLHPHTLRHACAVELVRRNNNLVTVQHHLRHADVGTTNVYARMLLSDLKEVVKLRPPALGQAVNRSTPTPGDSNSDSPLSFESPLFIRGG